jgi:hypothetical protein
MSKRVEKVRMLENRLFAKSDIVLRDKIPVWDFLNRRFCWVNILETYIGMGKTDRGLKGHLNARNKEDKKGELCRDYQRLLNGD